MTSPKVISERNLDGKTIRKDESGNQIEVAVDSTTENAIEVTDNGLIVRKPKTVALQSLGGIPLGEVILND